MTISTGTRLGPYEVVAPIGAGGMGEVYKAKDTRLDRTVAIKVLPEHLAESPERKARFEREAKAISQLNHPHICTLYDVGEQDGIDFIVMEYIEGETLAERLKKGALKLGRALEYGIQIADGLDKAHRAAIVHRDLKPGNVMLTKSGVKLLDFGLARLVEGENDAESSDAPTRQKDLTAEESIIGTLQYMAPEQLERKPADARTDVFAFGVVLYEMLTGRKAFEGSSQASLIAAILEHEPTPIATLQPLSPPPLERLVTRCIAKNPDRRWQSAGDLALELEWCREAGSAAASTVNIAVIQGRKNRERFFLGSSFVLMALLAWRILLPNAAVDTSITRLEIGLPPGQELTGFLDISPDGRRVAYTAKQGMGPSRLYLRSLDSFEARLVDGTDGATQPFFSPDGERVGFFAGGKLLRVPFVGGEAFEIAEARSPYGGSWGEDDSIIFAMSASGLFRVPSAGGSVETLTTPDNEAGGYTHAWPQLLPDGRHVLFSIWRAEERLRFGTAILSLDSGAWRIVIDENSSGARYVDSGHLVYTFGPGSALMSVPFGLETLEVYGDPAPVLDAYYRTGAGHSPFAVSRTGTLAFNPEDPTKRTLVWVDREGRESPLTPARSEQQHQYDFPRISPDGLRIAFETARNLWVMDLDRGNRIPLTSRAFNTNHVWTRDGEGIVFSSNRDRTWNVYSKSIRGTGEPEFVARGEYGLFPHSMSIDGTIAASQTHPATGSDIWTIQPGQRPEPVVVSPFYEDMPQLSPDGRFLAYVSDHSGRLEVYVQLHPVTDERWLISTHGGTEPLWSPDGSELFYRRGNSVMAVAIESASGFEPGIPRTLFDGDYLVASENNPTLEYDISPDGQRFLMIRREPGSIPTRINVVLNWTEELKRLAPTSN